MNELAIQQSDDRGLRELALFAGAGGGILGGKLLGWRTVCAVEYDEHARNVLLARQDDGCIDPFPIWDDVTTFDGKPWAGLVDVISGGFPCQDISVAGKGKGLAGERSGLWSHMARIVDEIRPPFVFVENSPMLVGRGLGSVLADLSRMGYDARWGCIGACHAGLPHGRKRFWMVAYSNKVRFIAPKHDAAQWRHDKNRQTWEAKKSSCRWPHGFNGTVPVDYLNDWTIPEAGTVRGIDGMAEWMDRVARCGNGQVPAVAALAWKLLTGSPKQT
jgi:DNA (cytosine-5)-methyltransferase 1